MRLLGGVHGQRWQVRAPCHPPCPCLRRGPMARRRQRVQRRDRRRVVNHAFERLRQPEELPEPAEGYLFQLCRGGRGPPQHRLHVERGGKKLRQHAGGAARDGEVPEEAGVVPVGEAGDDYALEVPEDRLELHPFAGRVIGQRAADIARIGARQHRIAFRVIEVRRDPVDERMPLAPKCLRIHVAEASAGHAFSCVVGAPRRRGPSGSGAAARAG